MQIEPVINEIRAALLGHGALASGDPAVEAAVGHLATALDPALRQAVLGLVQQAAAEVSAQLADRRVDVVLLDGEPALRVSDAPSNTTESTASTKNILKR